MVTGILGLCRFKTFGSQRPTASSYTWWIPNGTAKFTFLAFHGNASNIANRAPSYEFLRSTPANILALEYRGYGHSEGKPDEAGIYRDAEAAYEYLVNTKRIDRKTIISFTWLPAARSQA